MEQKDEGGRSQLHPDFRLAGQCLQTSGKSDCFLLSQKEH